MGGAVRKWWVKKDWGDDSEGGQIFQQPLLIA